jgi:hypothetical protein
MYVYRSVRSKHSYDTAVKFNTVLLIHVPVCNILLILSTIFINTTYQNRVFDIKLVDNVTSNIVINIPNFSIRFYTKYVFHDNFINIRQRSLHISIALTCNHITCGIIDQKHCKYVQELCVSNVFLIHLSTLHETFITLSFTGSLVILIKRNIIRSFALMMIN